jgi:NAD+ kinase
MRSLDGGELWRQLRFLAVHPPEQPPLRVDSPLFSELMPLAGRISSAEIRRRLSQGEAVGDLLPPPVGAYIRRHSLYSGAIPSRQSPLRMDRPRLKIIHDRDNADAMRGYKLFQHLQNEDDPELILVLGGDGTMLRAIWDFWRERLPFFGINFGHLGFLMNQPEQEPFARPLTLYRLPMLRVEVETIEGEQIVGRAFMDAWIERQGGQSAKLQVEIDGQMRLEEVVADGMLVATPAGSSAYARAMGAPTIPLGAPLLTLVGSNVFLPYSWKPVVLPDTSLITLTSRGRSEKRPLRGFLDGRPIEGVLKKMMIRLGNVSDVELAFLPQHDPEVKMLQTLFPWTTPGKAEMREPTGEPGA